MIADLAHSPDDGAVTLQTTFVAPLYHIRVSEPLGRGERLTEKIRLTNDPQLIRKLIPIRWRTQIGDLEYNDLCNSQLLAYSETLLKVRPPDPSVLENHIASELFFVGQFIPFLWSVKDNAGSFETGFAFTESVVSKRFYGQIATLAAGHSESVSFSREQLQVARQRLRAFYGESLSPSTDNDYHNARTRELTSPDIPPAARAVFFVQAARGAVHLSIKIANYCSALETLLLPISSGELTRTLAQRVALLIGESQQERLQLFRDMKTIYEVRSKAVHGATRGANRAKDELPRAVIAADDILRRIFTRVFTFEPLAKYALGAVTDPAECEQIFLELSLGANPLEP
jgi:hypothetical protein